MASILAIDDDEDLLTLMGDYFAMNSHDFQSACNGLEGLRLLQSERFDLVVLDWDLPDMTGIEILSKFRKDGGLTPVIMLTGHGAVEDRVQGLETGANDYLTKPFHMSELIARVKSMLRTVSTQAPPPPALGKGNEQLLKAANLVGTSLPARYEFLEVLGEGAAGVVFKARHPELEKLVAIKMLHSFELNDEVIACFKQEAQAIAKLEHPNVVIVHDFGATERRQPYMVMDFIHGPTLETVLEERDHLPLQLGLDLLCQVADGLSHAHESGIVHRDVKPSNIMLKDSSDRAPIPKIVDFGLARFLDNAEPTASEDGLTPNGIGSPPYMSPEQVRGKQLDERSDIYSFACAAFETLTGYTPFVGKSITEIMLKHIQEPPMTLSDVQPEIEFPHALQTVIGRALEKDPSNRYQTLRAMRDELEAIALKLRVLTDG